MAADRGSIDVGYAKPRSLFLSQGYNGNSAKLEDAIRSAFYVHGETKEKIKLYDDEKILAKLSALPEYVGEATLNRLNDNKIPQNYDKVVLDKWGKKDVSTKKYVETPEIVFYRAAMLVADGLKKNDPSIDYDSTLRYIFDKFVNREIFPNTPFMANGGHKLFSKYVKDRLQQHADQRLMNELEQQKKIREQLFACFVFDIYDSRKSIFKTMTEAAEIQAHLGGTGFNFSNLRPANEMIHGTGGTTDGPIAFMATYSQVLGKTMNQAGKREGANMFMLDWNHPDIMRFIYSKREDGEISAANISVAVDHPFMEAVKSKGEGRFYPLKNSHYDPKERQHISQYYTLEQLKESTEITKINKKASISLLLAENSVDVLSPWIQEGMSDEYRVVGKIKDGIVYLDATKVLYHLAYSSWFNGEPGMIITGHINDHNPTHPDHYKKFLLEQKDKEAIEIAQRLRERNNYSLDTLIEQFVWERDEDGRLANLPIGVGVMRATNPCGEKPLLGYEACVLGHINLEKILERDNNEPSGYRINWDKLEENTRLMCELLDNAIDQNEFTIPEIEVTQKSNRKIGSGFMGMANMLYRLEIPYNSEDGRDFVDKLLAFWEKTSDEASFAKAERFGEFPNFKYSHHRNGKLKRNAIVRTLAPTGTTGFAAQTTGGMEPEYALAYERTTVQGTRVDMFNPVLEEKLEKYPFFRNDDERKKLIDYIKSEGNGSLQGFSIARWEGESEDAFKKRQENLERIKRIFVTTYDISPENHIRMEAIVQKHVDDAISKTTNFRNNATVEDVEKSFLLAYDLGIKGVTFYRDGTRLGQPLKVKGGKKSLEERTSMDELLYKLVVDKLNQPRPEYIGGVTERMHTPFGKGFLTFNFDDKENPYETFINIGKGGEDILATMEGFSRILSAAVRVGIPPKYFIDQLKGIGGKTQTTIPGEGWVRSLPDALGLAMEKVLNKKDKKILNKNGANGSTDLKSPSEEKTGNFCPKCGGVLIKKESCEHCPSCLYDRC